MGGVLPREPAEALRRIVGDEIGCMVIDVEGEPSVADEAAGEPLGAGVVGVMTRIADTDICLSELQMVVDAAFTDDGRVDADEHREMGEAMEKLERKVEQLKLRMSKLPVEGGA